MNQSFVSYPPVVHFGPRLEHRGGVSGFADKPSKELYLLSRFCFLSRTTSLLLLLLQGNSEAELYVGEAIMTPSMTPTRT